ncbi:homoserine O-acetyltransferase [Campylobacter sp. 19-13652]|uniref:homoserine O-acetyltransferase MetX n=1 Tax=Campylobacter sp. 19-13652 TaxID=2840180 RepID=UPI001C79A8C2|nr:homoserine O-acetyltransferase [Campylobacter sp. 19-13652]
MLREFSLKYESYGKLNEAKDNVIVITHALTGSHHAAGVYEGESRAGWWDELIGKNKAIDTDKFYVICVSILGAPFGSTCPLSINPDTGKRYGLSFPVLAISDVVRAQRRLFDRLGIKRARAVIGGSLGGMQALCFAIEHSDFADKTIMLASTWQTPPWAIAFNKIATHAIYHDIEFKNGEYCEEDIALNGLAGLEYARMAGHISFLSPFSMDAKFGRSYTATDGLYELFGRFEVERYLEYNSANFARRYDPLCYLYVIKMMNIFDCTRHYESLKDALSPIKSDMHLFSFSGDLLFVPSLMAKLANTLKSMGKFCDYTEVQSEYGHDAFLVETHKFDKKIAEILGD